MNIWLFHQRASCGETSIICFLHNYKNETMIKVVKSGTFVCFEVFGSSLDLCERGELGYGGLSTLWSMMFCKGRNISKIGAEVYDLLWWTTIKVTKTGETEK